MLVAAVIIVIGLMGFIIMLGSMMDKNELNERISIATTLAEEKIEDLKNQSGNAALENADSDNDTVNTIYTRTWTITNGGAGNLTQVVVTVSWTDSVTRNVSLSTLIRQ